MSKKKMPPAYGLSCGPTMVETHSNRLSPLGPAEQLHGGSRLISASSFCMRFAAEPPPFIEIQSSDREGTGSESHTRPPLKWNGGEGKERGDLVMPRRKGSEDKMSKEESSCCSE